MYKHIYTNTKSIETGDNLLTVTLTGMTDSIVTANAATETRLHQQLSKKPAGDVKGQRFCYSAPGFSQH